MSVVEGALLHIVLLIQLVSRNLRNAVLWLRMVRQILGLVHELLSLLHLSGLHLNLLLQLDHLIDLIDELFPEVDFL